MSDRIIGSNKKRDIAFVIASFLERGRTYPADEIERLIRDNVKHDVLAIPGLAPDHIRRAMLENGFCNRDSRTNQFCIADTFEAAQDIHGPRVAELRRQAYATPDERYACPGCGQTFKATTLYTHYVHKHAGPERWEEIMERYFLHS